MKETKAAQYEKELNEALRKVPRKKWINPQLITTLATNTIRHRKKKKTKIIIQKAETYDAT